MKKLYTVLILSFICSISAAQTWQDTLVLINRTFDRYKPDAPGCQLAISRNGKLIFSKAWGMADLDNHVPMSVASVIEAGSVSKQFTAASILLLEQRGNLSIEDEIHKYLPELPKYDSDITIEHMMHHTSGLKDIWGLLSLSDKPRGSRVYNNNDVLRIMSHQSTLNNKPGEEYLYSNSNYILLALIVERASGMTLQEFTQTELFQPAGMTHTEWRTDYTKNISGKAIAYGKDNNKYFIDMPLENVYGSGGLLTTAEDLLKWNNYYLSGKFGNPSLFKNQTNTVKLNGGGGNNYAAGLRIDNIRGYQVISHDGATAAYRALLESYPSMGISIAWLANTSEFDGKADGTGELRDLFLKRAEVPKPNTIPVSNNTPPSKNSETSKHFVISPAGLQEYAGDYYSDEVESKLSITLSDGLLTITRKNGDSFQLAATATDNFNIVNSKVLVRFERDKNGRILSLNFTNNRVRNVSFKKL